MIVQAARLAWASGRLAASAAKRLAASLILAVCSPAQRRGCVGDSAAVHSLPHAAARDCGSSCLARTRLARTRLARARLARARLARARLPRTRLARTRAHDAQSARPWPARLQSSARARSLSPCPQPTEGKRPAEDARTRACEQGTGCAYAVHERWASGLDARTASGAGHVLCRTGQRRG